jgi:hypothetical protein
MGSTITAATVLVRIRSAKPCTSPTSQKCTPGISGRKGSWYAGRSVAASAPMVRPWKPPRKATISCLRSSPCSRAQRRANLIAPSFASAPELQKNTRSANERATSHSASSAAGRVRNRLEVWITPASSAARIAAATSGSP